jgi:hypothetical protein
MADSDQLFREVLKIKSEVESLQRQTQWLLAGEADQLQEQWHPVFGLNKGKKPNNMKMRVYLAVDGRRNIREVATEAGVDQSDASKLLADLEYHSLVEPLPQTSGKTKIYAKTPADRPLGISRTLRERVAQRAEKQVPEDAADTGQ